MNYSADIVKRALISFFNEMYVFFAIPLLFKTNLSNGIYTKKHFLWYLHVSAYASIFLAFISYVITGLNNNISLNVNLMLTMSWTMIFIISALCNVLYYMVQRKLIFKSINFFFNSYLAIGLAFSIMLLFIIFPNENFTMVYATNILWVVFFASIIPGLYTMMSRTTYKWYVLKDLFRRQTYQVFIYFVLAGVIVLSVKKPEFLLWGFLFIAGYIVFIIKKIWNKPLNRKALATISIVFLLLTIAFLYRVHDIPMFVEQQHIIYLGLLSEFFYVLNTWFFQDFLLLPSIDPAIAKNLDIGYLLFDPRFIGRSWERHSPSDENGELELCFKMLEQHIPEIRFLYDMESNWPAVQRRYMELQDTARVVSMDNALECDF